MQKTTQNQAIKAPIKSELGGKRFKNSKIPKKKMQKFAEKKVKDVRNWVNGENFSEKKLGTHGEKNAENRKKQTQKKCEKMRIFGKIWNFENSLENLEKNV